MNELSAEEISRACAERLGWERRRSDGRWRINEAAIAGGTGERWVDAWVWVHPSKDWDERISPPDFHGSMDAAMQLVEKANNSGWYFSFTAAKRQEKQFCGHFEGRNGESFYHYDDSPSAAICAAFLKLPLT